MVRTWNPALETSLILLLVSELDETLREAALWLLLSCRSFTGISNTLVTNAAFTGELCTAMVIFPLGFLGTKILLLHCKEGSVVNYVV